MQWSQYNQPSNGLCERVKADHDESSPYVAMFGGPRRCYRSKELGVTASLVKIWATGGKQLQPNEYACRDLTLYSYQKTEQRHPGPIAQSTHLVSALE